MLLILFFCLFLSIPIIEIGLFIQIGNEIGILATLILIITTALIGSFLVHSQGKTALKQAQRNLNQGIFPLIWVTDGVGLLVAGLMLITPGFFTDTIGFICLIPQSRRAICHYLFKLLQSKANISTKAYYQDQQQPIMEGDYYHTPPKTVKDLDS